MEDFVNYKVPSLFLITSTCNWKCCDESGIPRTVCQNFHLTSSSVIDYSDEDICMYYIMNPITQAVVIGGLEPMDTFDELFMFVKTLREHFRCNDDVVIYTGYNENEIVDKIKSLSEFKNIIIKFGRYKPNQKSHYDNVLGVKLASSNQYAKKIS